MTTCRLDRTLLRIFKFGWGWFSSRWFRLEVVQVEVVQVEVLPSK